MAIVTTYICDISGKQGDKKEFVTVIINSTPHSNEGYSYQGGSKTIEKLVHYDVALKLGIIDPRKSDVLPEQTPTFESQLSVLLKDYIADMVYDEVAARTNNHN
jgi:hypothetical protein